MKVLLAASEVHPFAKTGGLADVCGALPRALKRAGVDVAVALPYYRKVRARNDPVEVVSRRVSCPFADGNRPFRLLRTELPGGEGVPLYLVENPGVFEAEEAFYGTEPGSYGDGHLRFLYFARSILRLPRGSGFHPDVLHLNDWQTALAAPLLRTVHRGESELDRTAAVLTIHNLAYQGTFPVEDLRHAGLPEFLLSEGRLLEKGVGNLMAGGIRFSDAVSTVSRTYAQEILTPEYGAGLEGVLGWRRDLLRGIVNGLDTEVWNPATDPHLPAHYDADDPSGKRACRVELLERAGLGATDGPVFGIVSRLADQKGLGLVPPVMEALLARRGDARLVVLGSGDPRLEDAFKRLEAAHGGRVHVRLGFDAPFSSLVEAGSDFFLMPSRFEPCGLNQLISMRYGTPPIVRRVGGLRDTVTDATEETFAEGTATGFCFDAFEPGALADAVERAVTLYDRRPDAYAELRRNGMRTDWSWERSAAEYVDMYEEALRRAETPLHLQPLIGGLPPDPLEVELPPLADVPGHYERKKLLLFPQDPATLFAFWEVPHAVLQEATRGIDPARVHEAHCELVLEDKDTGEQRGRRVAASGWAWLKDVSPGHTYGASVYLHVPGRESRPVLEHAALEMPADVWPEDR